MGWVFKGRVLVQKVRVREGKTQGHILAWPDLVVVGEELLCGLESSILRALKFRTDAQNVQETMKSILFQGLGLVAPSSVVVDKLLL